MYSSRKYKKRKSHIQKIFNPYLMKSPYPNYYQQKGRTLQTTPLYMNEPDNEMVTRPLLDKWFKKLQEYKYDFNSQLNIIQPFIVHHSKFIRNLFPEDEFGFRNYKFNTSDLYSLSMSMLRSNYPDIVNLYNWRFHLLYIQFINNTDTPIDSGKQYIIQWNTHLLEQGYWQIFVKSIDAAISSYFNPSPIGASPNGINQDTGKVIVRAERVSVTNASYIISANNMASNDNILTDNGAYPLMSTDNSQPLYQGELEFVPGSGMEQGDISQSLIARLFILCQPIVP